MGGWSRGSWSYRSVVLAWALVLTLAEGGVGQEPRDAVAIEFCPGVELMSLVHLLGGSRFATGLEAAWVDQARDHFAPWADHPAVTRSGAVLRGETRLDGLARMLHRAGPPPGLALPEKPDGGLEQSFDGALLSFLDDLRDFALRSGFEDFLTSRAEERARVVERERAALLDGFEAAEAYLGRSLRGVVCLNPYFTAGSISWEAGEGTGAGAVVVLGPTGADDGTPDFGGLERLDAELLVTFLRPVVSSLVEESRDTLAHYAELFQTIAAPLGEVGISDWPTAWREHLARAVALRLLERRAGEGAGAREWMVRSGFAYLEPLLRTLERFERRRDRYPTLESARPLLLATLDRELQIARSVGVDPRVELMTAVQRLAGWWLLSCHDSPYERDLDAFLRDASRHPAVVTYRRMSAEGFRFDAVPRFFALLSPLPELDFVAPIPDEVARRGGGSERLRVFAEELRAFARSTGFDAFLATHRGTYEAVELHNRAAVADAADALWDYLGVTPETWRVALGLLLHDGGFATGDEGVPPQAFVGPVTVTDGIPDFGGIGRIGPLIWHEFSHPTVNALADVHPERVAELSFAFEPLREVMAEQAYPTWITSLNEHVVRAVEVRVTARVVGEEVAEELVAEYVGRGFRYLPALADELGAYEANRGRYPTIGDFYPRLLDRLERAARESSAG